MVCAACSAPSLSTPAPSEPPPPSDSANQLPGIIRHYYGWAPNLAKAVADFQYPDPDSGKGTLHLTHTNGIRMLYKRLRQLHTTVAFEFLSDDQLNDLLLKYSGDLQRG